MNKDIEEAKKILYYMYNFGKVKRDNHIFSKYSMGYFSSNENINEVLNFIDISNLNNILTVLASGDQLFNFISKGSRNIDTFDINKLTQYNALGLKRAMILKYDREDYINTMSLFSNEKSNINEIIDTVKSLLPYMDNEYRIFWNEILDYYYNLIKNGNITKNLFYLLYIYFPNIEILIYINNYLQNDKEYQLLKNSIGQCNISFICHNCFSLFDVLDKEYDLIYLSNIIQYYSEIKGINWGINEFDELILLLSKHLSVNGIVATYLFLVTIYGKKNDVILPSSKLRYSDLDIIEISRINSNINKDGLNLCRKMTKNNINIEIFDK